MRPETNQATTSDYPPPWPDADESFFVERFLPYLINRIANRFNQRFKVALKKMGISVSQWRVIALLRSRPGLSLSEIASYTVIDQPTLSRTIDQLVEAGLVSRTPRVHDGRFLSISLSPKGVDLFEQVWPIAWRHNLRGVAGVSTKEQEVLVQLLRKVLDNLDRSD